MGGVAAANDDAVAERSAACGDRHRGRVDGDHVCPCLQRASNPDPAPEAHVEDAFARGERERVDGRSVQAPVNNVQGTEHPPPRKAVRPAELAVKTSAQGRLVAHRRSYAAVAEASMVSTWSCARRSVRRSRARRHHSSGMRP